MRQQQCSARETPKMSFTSRSSVPLQTGLCGLRRDSANLQLLVKFKNVQSGKVSI